MANIGEEKRYGLITAKKPQLSAPRPGNIFSNNSDSDSDNGTDWMKKALKSNAEKRIKKKTQNDMQKALKDDPTIYQYDEVYDEMKIDKCEAKDQKKEAKKPRYIHNLLKTAERRKIEQQHRIELMVQKERAAEGAQFANKESFITSAYKAKLEEFKKLQEEELRMERLEAIGDVTKQRDMSGFYRHLYRQKVGIQLGENESEKVKETSAETVSVSNTENIDRDDIISSESEAESDNDSDEEHVAVGFAKKNKSKHACDFPIKRQCRKRVSESESEVSSEDYEESDKGDTGRGSDHEEYDTENEEPTIKRARIQEVVLNDYETEQLRNEGLKVEEENLDKIIKKVAGRGNDTEVEVEKITVAEPKRSIWEKRCYGDLFEEAVRRYHERKAERLVNNVVY